MVAEVDPITWQAVAAGGAAVLSSLVAYVVKKNDTRIDAIESASVHSLEAHRKEDRETFKALFEGQADIKDTLSEGFSDMSKTMHGIHATMLGELNKKADK